MPAPLHARLWDANRALVERIRLHPFVRGLEDGSLDTGAFRRYVAQDAFFLLAFARGYSLAGARAPGAAELRAFHELVAGVLEELETHRRYALALDIDLDAVEPFAETLAYTGFLDEIARRGGLAEILAAMTPCMRLYAHLGQELAATGIPDHAYRDWIETYASADFEALARRLEALLDAHAEDTEAVGAAYARAMACELDFFSAPLRNHSK